jgi:hypothetical protein
MREITVGKNLTANTLTTLYTVPSGCVAVINFIYIINNGTSNKTIDVDWYNASLATKIHLMALQSLSSKTFLQITDPRIVLNAGDYIEATSETGSSMTIMFTVELSQAPQVQYHAN